jgi:hypothetical protein
LAGATNPACNGEYSIVDEYNGKNRYKLDTGDFWLLWDSDENRWVLTMDEYIGQTEYFLRANASEFGAYANSNGTGNVTFVQS